MAITFKNSLELLESWHQNLSVPALIEAALERGEGMLTDSGALVTRTGRFTGRSPKDRFIVKDPAIADQIDWGSVNQPIAPEKFESLYQRVLAYLKERDAFVFDGFAGADPKYRLHLRVITERAWHNLFAHQLFIRPKAEERLKFKPEMTILHAPGFTADPEKDGTNSECFIILDLRQRIVIIGGTEYAGEIKKSVFSTLNYLLPQQGVLPMHCSANVGEQGDVALFFGLSGTGKTTLSADPKRRLIGDDEHGWTDTGIFNFEGGCYAKCINLSAEKEPQIYAAIRFGTVLENVIIDIVTRQPDYDDGTLTENTRAAYPLEYIPNAVIPGVAGHPKVILFLTADAFGVLPPIARLNENQAMYHFLSGYTSKLAGTERGVTDPEATFSTCFGAPFLPLPAVKYAEMLGQRIRQHNTRVFLVNTGWTGGPYGVGRRIDLPYTRAMVSAAIAGELENVQWRVDPVFGFEVPTSCPGVPANILDPRSTWSDGAAYDEQLRNLAQRFLKNFEKFSGVDENIRQAGPKI